MTAPSSRVHCSPKPACPPTTTCLPKSQEPERPDLRRDHRVRADLAVVADVHEIVQFHAFGDARVVERAAIDRRVRSDFDIVGNFHDARLRKFPVPPFAVRVAKSVCANDRAGMNFHAMPDADAGVKSDARMNPAILADPAACADHGMRADLRSLADMCIFADHGDTVRCRRPR